MFNKINYYVCFYTIVLIYKMYKYIIIKLISLINIFSKMLINTQTKNTELIENINV